MKSVFLDYKRQPDGTKSEIDFYVSDNGIVTVGSGGRITTII